LVQRQKISFIQMVGVFHAERRWRRIDENSSAIGVGDREGRKSMETGQKRSRGRPRSFNPKPEQTTIQALERAVGILKVLADGEGMSLTELAEASGQATATVYRVLSTLEAHGIVEVQPATQLWFVGQEAFRIGSAFLGRTNLVEQARGVMHALMAETGETANLAIADGGQVIFISQVETHEPIRAFFRPGTRGPIHASGIGKALLA
jgi:IclR family acetate operon transcriptional repressor